MTEQEIRSDWAAALRSVKYGYQLSRKIDWGFYPEDIERLTALYKAGKYREKILDLLEDCNFHTEAALLEEEDYETLLNHDYME